MKKSTIIAHGILSAIKVFAWIMSFIANGILLGGAILFLNQFNLAFNLFLIALLPIAFVLVATTVMLQYSIVKIIVDLILMFGEKK